ncbi:outer membrane porin [Azotobacter vinelandii CA]|uniref:Bacterial outer membrane porin n=2 Tax=Azotobacter vinelandii TaxID=354 RepID=C1DL34_AZOVD|nr:OprD family porin [Azotobacter vinelandii]ACO81027.1 Bacterial outer membrane porin [Azotobacter vinelandii DJ]AGK14195.1 outer membrane porin [Azotobacter vinelandii CA]AGK22307.1 outer membrane porin [Azotobacter vinelandii CA6]SFY11765.1 outer membrane porin, OprD family [Azotobacter vinelandii]GLK60864.1 porin [Azotobacter vinelandii]
MYKTPLASGLTATALLGMAFPPPAKADFLEDSKASLELRNFYFNSDYRQDGANQSKRDEWAQGFLLRYESGFTEGTVGFGVDMLGLLGLKLDSGPERQNSGLLPVGDDKAPDSYSRLGATAKVRISDSVLRIGTLDPRLPTVLPNDSRLLPQTFQGSQLTFKEIDGLTIDAGRLTRNNLRNESNREDLAVTGKGITGERSSDRFDFATLSYRWDNQLTTTYSYARLDENYRQHIVNLVHVLPIDKRQSFRSDLRFARSREDGDTNVDNDAFGARFTYRLDGHGFGAAYQKMSGETGFPRIDGTDPFLVNYVMLSPDFANPDEKSWQLRYDFDFASVGIPGLTFMTRYLRGDNFDRGAKEGREWERNTDIAYVFQSGSLKNLGLKWRNGTYRSNGGSDIDQNRVIVSYTIPLL